MRLNSLEDVFESELKDLYSAEQQLVEALPSIASAATSKELMTAIQSHLQETRHHVQRLEAVFESIGMKAEGEHCDGMEGLISEGSEMAEAEGDGDARDAALIGAAQRVEHYEIAAYGTARTLAQQLGHNEAADLLGQTLEEESAADEKLTEIATSSVNAAAK
ncbi:MAG TPA: ferritin-like domain-containing protein [Gaiellales bacterium]|jgi:ferritin-like metal-binding protein YciE|nr:ferritin-like domain-containing protein [Gaiellales bacterium]